MAGTGAPYELPLSGETPGPAGRRGASQPGEARRFRRPRAACMSGAMASPPELRPILYALQDSVMLLAPKGWAVVDVKVEPVEGALRATELATQGQGGRSPAPKPRLHVEPRDEAVRLSEGIAELAHLLGQAGKPWSGGTLRVERTGELADWKLLRPDGSLAWFSRLERRELEQLLVTDALFDALAGTERAFDELQRRFEGAVGAVTGTSYDPQTRLLALRREGAEKRVSAQLLGRFALDTFSWEWGWADEELPPETAAKVRSVCAPEAQSPGFAALWRDQFHCDEGFAWALMGHVMVSVGARGIVRVVTSDQEAAVFFAALEEP